LIVTEAVLSLADRGGSAANRIQNDREWLFLSETFYDKLNSKVFFAFHVEAFNVILNDSRASKTWCKHLSAPSCSNFGVCMPIYWTLKSIPEFSDLSLAERNRSWARIRSKAFRHWQTWLGLLGCAMLSGIGSLLGEKWGHSSIGAAIGGGVGGFVYFQALVHVARSYYLAILVGRST